MSQEKSPPVDSRPISEVERVLTDESVKNADPMLTRIDKTGYSITMFDGAVHVFEPPAPRRDEPVTRVAEIQFVSDNGNIIAVAANRDMLICLARSINKAMRVGDEFYGVDKW